MNQFFRTVFSIAVMVFTFGPSSGLEAALGSAPSQKSLLINLEYLCKQWVHSSEEQKPTDKAQLYRPSDFKHFPPSRGRMKYIFYKNGDCEWYFFSPDDAHHFKPGKWQIDPNDKRILRITKGDATESYRVLELTKDILRIALIEPSRRDNK